MGNRYHDARVIRFPYFSGVSGTEQYTLELLVGGQRLEIGVDSYAPLVNIPASGPQLSRSAARFRFDGETGGGLLERSLKPEYPSGGEYVDQS